MVACQISASLEDCKLCLDTFPVVGWLGGGWVVVVVKSNNSANSAQLSYANQLELSLAIITYIKTSV